jgi:quercetin dioxygenase-like cupin family protein
MKIVNFSSDTSTPHPNFKGVMLSPILNEDAKLGIRSSFVLISPSCEISPHIHDVVEVFTIISGYPSVLIEDNWIPVTPGTTIVAPPGELHGVRNSTDTEVILQANFNCNI